MTRTRGGGKLLIHDIYGLLNVGLNRSFSIYNVGMRSTPQSNQNTPVSRRGGKGFVHTPRFIYQPRSLWERAKRPPTLQVGQFGSFETVWFGGMGIVLMLWIVVWQ